MNDKNRGNGAVNCRLVDEHTTMAADDAAAVRAVALRSKRTVIGSNVVVWQSYRTTHTCTRSIQLV